MKDETPSWEEVARDHGRFLYMVAYRLTGNRDDAQDLVQDVLIRVQRGLVTYQPGSLRGWLSRITTNAFLDGVRRKKRRPTTALPDDLDRSSLASTPAPDDVLASIRLGDDVQKALLALPYDFRESVVMCDLIGLSYDEIAMATEVPVGTVRSRIHRGRKMLREALQ